MQNKEGYDVLLARIENDAFVIKIIRINYGILVFNLLKFLLKKKCTLNAEIKELVTIDLIYCNALYY